MSESENMETKETSLINWQDFEVKSANERIVLEVGKKYELGFNSITQSTIEVVDTEKTEEGKVEVKKTIPILRLGVDFLDGKPTTRELTVTSKKLIQTIKTYFEREMLFSRIFQLEKSGSGFQTVYQLIALEDKPNRGRVEATL